MNIYERLVEIDKRRQVAGLNFTQAEQAKNVANKEYENLMGLIISRLIEYQNNKVLEFPNCTCPHCHTKLQEQYVTGVLRPDEVQLVTANPDSPRQKFSWNEVEEKIGSTFKEVLPRNTAVALPAGVKPCPHCGGYPTMYKVPSSSPGISSSYFLECCDNQTALYVRPDNAKDTWNEIVERNKKTMLKTLGARLSNAIKEKPNRDVAVACTTDINRCPQCHRQPTVTETAIGPAAKFFVECCDTQTTMYNWPDWAAKAWNDIAEIKEKKMEEERLLEKNNRKSEED